MTQMMKVFGVLAFIIPFAAQGQTRLHASISVGSERGPSRFYVELRDYYGVPYDQVCAVRSAGLPDEDMPDILYIYTHSRYSLRHIINLRLRGATWKELYTWCGLAQDLYYRPVYRTGPPYGNAWGYYRNHRVPVYRDDGRDGYDRGYADGRRHGNGKHKGWKRD